MAGEIGPVDKLLALRGGGVMINNVWIFLENMKNKIRNRYAQPRKGDRIKSTDFSSVWSCVSPAGEFKIPDRQATYYWRQPG